MRRQEIVQIIRFKGEYHSGFPMQQIKQLLLVGVVQGKQRRSLFILVVDLQLRKMLPDVFLDVRKIDTSGMGYRLFQVQRCNILASLHRNHAVRILKPLLIFFQEMLLHRGFQLPDIGGHQHNHPRQIQVFPHILHNLIGSSDGHIRVVDLNHQAAVCFGIADKVQICINELV